MKTTIGSIMTPPYGRYHGAPMTFVAETNKDGLPTYIELISPAFNGKAFLFLPAAKPKTFTLTLKEEST